MNIRHYTDHKMRIAKWYLVSYNFITKDFKNGFGTSEIRIFGFPDMKQLRVDVLKTNRNFENIVIINVMQIKKSANH